MLLSFEDNTLDVQQDKIDLDICSRSCCTQQWPVSFDTDDDRIKSGMTANITVISETHNNVLTVPKSAVIKNNNKYFVLVNKGNSQKETREVSVGLHDDTNIEIISGLQLGEKVLAY